MKPWIKYVIAFIAGVGLSGMGQARQPIAPVAPDVRVWQAVTPGLNITQAEAVIGVKGGGDSKSTEQSATGVVEILNRAYPIGGGVVLGVRYEKPPGATDFVVDNKMMALKIE